MNHYPAHASRAFRQAIFLLALEASLQCQAQVVLSEIMFNPEGSEHLNEFVELVNTGSDTVSLSGWRIGDGIADDTIIDAGQGCSLGPGQYGLILDPDYFSEPEAYADRIPKTCRILTLAGSTFGSGGFSNSEAETVRLTDAAGYEVAAYTYSTENLSGYSDEKIRLEAGDMPGNWANAIVPGGTPGFVNSVSSEPHTGSGQLRAEPNPFSPDGDGYQDETTVSYLLPARSAWVHLRLFDIRGRQVRTLAAAERSGSAGMFHWDGKDDSGGPVSSGIYILFLEMLDDAKGIVLSLQAIVVVAGR